MSAGLRFAGVDRRFGRQNALRGLALDCPPARLTCLVGPNGAGKSTALALAAGLLEPTAGAVLFEDRGVEPRRAPATTGYLPQRSAFHRALKVGEVIDFTVAARAATPGERRLGLAVTGVETVAKRFVGELSGGWVRRLGLFSALVGSPRLLLLDEPFVGLDPETNDRLVAHLRDRLGSGATVVVASHDFDAVDPFAPRVAVLDEGRLVLEAVVGEGDEGDAAGLSSSREIYRRALGAEPVSPGGKKRR